jgi:hypothetical protein
MASPRAVKSATVESEPTAPTGATPVWTPAPTGTRSADARSRSFAASTAFRAWSEPDGRHVERHHLVADELVDDSVAVDHDTIRAVEESVHQHAKIRRLHLLRERRRPAHVGGQH